MIGKFAKKATKAGGVAFNISSKALVVWPPTAATTGFDKVLEAAGTPAEVVVWKFPAPTEKGKKKKEIAKRENSAIEHKNQTIYQCQSTYS